MSDLMAGVTLHIDEGTTHDERETFRDSLLTLNGVMAAACHDEKSHLILIEYDPKIINSIEFVNAASRSGFHAELIGI
jgi:hypothetical protein